MASIAVCVMTFARSLRSKVFMPWMPPCLLYTRLRLALYALLLDGLDSLAVYSDGSYQPRSNTASWAIAVFGRTMEGTWLWCGCCYGQLSQAQLNEGGSSPYPAEICAMACAFATIYAADVKQATLFYDATAAYGVATCAHSAAKPTCLQSAARSAYLLASAKGVQLFGMHTPSHLGNPGNELADSLTKLAYQQSLDADCEAFLLHAEIGWLWTLHASHYGLPVIGDDGTSEPQTSSCYPMPPVDLPLKLACPAPEPQQERQSVAFNVATYNTLSLKSRQQQVALSTLFQQAQCQVVGLQETRLPAQPVTHYGPYTAFASPADAGTDGCHLWVDFHKPIGLSATGVPILFDLKTS